MKPAPRTIMGKSVPTCATVPIHKSAIMYVDAYKSQLGWTTSQPTTQMQYPRIQSKPVFLLLTPALVVQVGILYLDNDDVCLFGVYRPTREYFTHMETSPLPVKGCKF